MPANKIFRLGPVALTNAVANYLNPGTTAGGVGMGTVNGNLWILLRHLRLVNKAATGVTATLYIGATAGSAAGTEYMLAGYTVAANSFVDWYGTVRLDVADFLTAVAGANTSITMQGEGEIGIA
jgi:hypothetical protein